ncbi:uncharacterized protein LOC17876154 isoform X2 [Capsella rubella]|uniref:uncharacterized protein LOC17876154 isoform X2 n=1 Tax=Capsella rubella TaxID=81985 RepID=UPI000CD5B5D2|nr:uncharacterized protein LOC17876154 isoform X2 [Capsella rubella]
MVDKSGYESPSDIINLSDSAKKKKKKKNNKKKPCEVCGSAANELLVMTCFKCRDTREHTYCARVILQRVPRIWLCEECRDSSSANPHVKEAAQLSRTMQVEQAAVNKVSIDQTVPLSRTKLLVDIQDPIDRAAPSSRTIQAVDNGISTEAALSSRTNQVLYNKDWSEAAPSSRTNQVVEQVVPVVAHIQHQYTTQESTPFSLDDETHLFHFNYSSVSRPPLMKKRRK